jgi:glucokinase
MFLGIEIGGTKLQLGVGSGEGPPLRGLERCDIDRKQGAAGILSQILETARPLIEKHGVHRIGVGFGGPVDYDSGHVLTSHQVAGWEGIPLSQWCGENLGWPAVLGNDCDCAALAEARFGAGRGRHCVFFVTVGTGIGGGLVINGKLHGEGRAAVAEIGHLRPGPLATSPHATVESVSSGLGIARVAAELTRQQPASVHSKQLLESCAGDAAHLTAQIVSAEAAKGNTVAQQALQESIRVLGWAIAQVVSLVAADVIVIGGGVSLMGEEAFFEPLRCVVAEYVFPPLRDAYQVLPAALGEEVVVHGALALAAEK